MNLSLSLTLGSFLGDSTPDGGTDVWLFEDNIAMLWESGIFAPTE